MENEIREAAKGEDLIITGDFDHLYTDWINVCSCHVKEIKFLYVLNEHVLEQVDITTSILPNLWSNKIC